MNIAKILDKFFDNKMETFETAMPGTVASFNDDGTVSVRPSIRNCLRNMQIEPDGSDGLPLPIPGIPVLWPGTSSTLIKYELVEGDPVLLISSSRDTRKWLENGWAAGPQDPVSFSGNDLNDLMALPVRLLGHQSLTDKRVIKPKSTITIKTDGTIQVESKADVSVKANTVKVDASEAEFTGSLKVGGSIDADGDVTAMAKLKPITLATHQHAYVGPEGPATTTPVP